MRPNEKMPRNLDGRHGLSVCSTWPLLARLHESRPLEWSRYVDLFTRHAAINLPSPPAYSGSLTPSFLPNSQTLPSISGPIHNHAGATNQAKSVSINQ